MEKKETSFDEIKRLIDEQAEKITNEILKQLEEERKRRESKKKSKILEFSKTALIVCVGLSIYASLITIAVLGILARLSDSQEYFDTGMSWGLAIALFGILCGILCLLLEEMFE